MPRQQVQPHGRPLEFARIVFITLSSRRGSRVRPAAAKLPHGNMIIGVSLIEGESEAGERVDPRILVVVFITLSSRRGSWVRPAAAKVTARQHDHRC